MFQKDRSGSTGPGVAACSTVVVKSHDVRLNRSHSGWLGEEVD